MLFALELEKCTINKVPLNDCTPVTGRGCARSVSALLRVYSYRLVLTPTKRRKVSSYAPSPCVSHYPWQCRQNLFPAFILFLAFTTISKAALSPITIAVAIYSSHIRVIFPCFAATPMPLVIRSSPLPTLYTCCPPSNRLFRCHHRFLPPAPLRSLLHGCSPPRRCPPSRGQCHRRGRCPCFPPSLLWRKLEAISKAQ